MKHKRKNCWIETPGLQSAAASQPASHFVTVQLLSLHANALKRIFCSAQNRLFLL